MVKPIPSPKSSEILTEDSNYYFRSTRRGVSPAYPDLYGGVLVSTGVVRLDKRVVAPDHDKTGIF